MRIISHIINIIVASFIATVFMFPISTSDVYFVATLGSHLVWLTIPIMVIVDTITAMGAYKLSYWLVPKIVNRKLKPKEKIAINIIIHLVWFGACIVGAAMFDVFCGVAVCYVGYLIYYLLARLYVHKVNSVDVDNDEKRMIRIGEKSWKMGLVVSVYSGAYPFSLYFDYLCGRICQLGKLKEGWFCGVYRQIDKIYSSVFNYTLWNKDILE